MHNGSTRIDFNFDDGFSRGVDIPQMPRFCDGVKIDLPSGQFFRNTVLIARTMTTI